MIHPVDDEKHLHMQYPPVGKYESINLELYKERRPKWRHQADKSLGQRLEKLKKDDSPSPVTYEK